jgi:hypothetical protein
MTAVLTFSGKEDQTTVMTVMTEDFLIKTNWTSPLSSELAISVDGRLDRRPSLLIYNLIKTILLCETCLPPRLVSRKVISIVITHHIYRSLHREHNNHINNNSRRQLRQQLYRRTTSSK